MRRLVICIPTYRRNLQLKALLAALQGQSPPSPGETEASILVVDNNPDGRAASIAAAYAEAVYPVRYVHETRPGVAYVRNRALEECVSDDFLVFIDDDELPAAGWLKTLWRRYEETGAEAVFGTVEARYADGAPDWLLRGDFHSKPVSDNGLREKPGATDNCLIDLAAVRRRDLSFNTALSTVGGEDTLFFDAMLRGGAVFANARDAVTYESVPADRATLDWLVARWWRTGFTDAMMVALGRPEGLRRPLARLDGLARILVGGALSAGAWVVSGFRMHERVARFLYTFHRGRGMSAWAFDRRVEEYARPAAAGDQPA